MESATLLLEIHVHCEKPLEVQGHSKRVVFIPFTATASGPDFEGEVVGPGVDTQIYDLDGAGGLSARYILRGKDSAGNPCQIFIQNEGNPKDGLHPMIVTDSPVLAHWEKLPLFSTLTVTPQEVLIKIYSGE